MNDDNAKNFSRDWSNHGDEKSDTQKFWRALLRKVFAVDEPDEIIDFEKRVKINEQTKSIDGYIARSKVLIEQKSFGTDLNKTARQSDGEFLTPFEQARRYAEALPYSQQPRKIIVCNFAEFHIYDLVDMNSLEYLVEGKIYNPVKLSLKNFRYDFAKLKFIVDPNAEVPPEVKISRDAAKLLKIIYDAFKKYYLRARVDNYKNSLDILCTRLVFCFYAAYAKIFDADKFFAALKDLDALQNVFDILNTPENLRGNSKLDFPYVNGGLFSKKISLPIANRFDADPFNSIRAANSPEKFNWRKISPPIFGAMFESILSDDERRAAGMHYTSIENIHKVIDPLFLDDLDDEFKAAKNKRIQNRAEALLALQDKISSLKFFDPACGSGNFLTETYMSLRRLENKILAELRSLNFNLPADPVKVSINQFYGIEINDFAVAVAQTALWIAENQMLQETAWIIGHDLNELPLKNYATIRQANALKIDWAQVISTNNLTTNNLTTNNLTTNNLTTNNLTTNNLTTNNLTTNNLTTNNLTTYIIGNPPFVGARMKSAEQTADIKKIFAGWKNLGNFDYVTCWFKKTADFLAGTKIRAAFVATNSVCQGDSVGTLWKNLFEQGIHIDFAHRTFKWLSDSENMAHVHCVIVGFSSAPNPKPKIIFDGKKKIIAENINAYLVEGEDIFVESRPNHLQDGVPPIGIGNKPIDGGNYLFTPEEMEDFIKHEPASEKYFKPWFGAEEFINGKKRFCLLLKDLPLDEIKKMPLCWERVENVRQYRLKSKSAGTRKIADKPTRFHVENFPSGNYLAISKTSSGTRQYIPIGFMDDSVICSDRLLLVPNATLYHFGVLTSSIHMSWMRATTGYLGTSYNYSNQVVYNNFVWCRPSERQRRRIEQTAQEILNVRADFPDWTLAKLYNEDTMPKDLRDAHKENDLAVALAYGFEKFLEDEAKIVAELMKLYSIATNK